MTGPKVINLKGRKPQVVPEGAVYIGRRSTLGGWNLPKSKWANPFPLPPNATDEQRAEVIAQYEGWLRWQPDLMAALSERGKDLACWCAPKACHGHVRLRPANGSR